MADLEVQAVDEIPVPGPVTAPSFVLYGGKGGVGKTTMAAATGLASALDGTSTLVVSTDPAHSLAEMYDCPLGPEPTSVREDLPLWGVELDPETALDADTTGLGATLGGEGGPLGQLLGEGALPGADEALAMQQLLTSVEDDRFDRVVVDTAPTGHTLRLLELPDVLDSFLGQAMQWRERMGDMLGNLPGFGDEDAGAEPDLGLDELASRVERLREVLQDPERTDFRIVVVPETLSVAESQRLLDRLDEYGIHVGTIVVNRVLEDPATVVDESLAAAFAAPEPEDCAFCRSRWEVQQAALAAAQELFGQREVKRVPLLATEVRGTNALRVVAACLA